MNSPTHDYKKQVVLEYARKYNCRTLVETGTYLGEMVEAMIPHFDRIISIELSEDLYMNAFKKFSGAHNVLLLQGDSGKLMWDVCQTLDGPTVFWLDAHYSYGITAKGDKECPVMEELRAIYNTPRGTAYSLCAADTDMVILIDDARLFDGVNWPNMEDVYDSRLDKLENDIIRRIA